MDNSKYEKIVKEGVRVDWHGEQVPEELITNRVKVWCEGLLNEIHLLEGELSDLRGTSLDKRKSYLKSLWSSVKTAPYKLNGDTYLIKKTRFEEEIKEKDEKPKKTTRKRKTRTTKTTKPTSKASNTTKNSKSTKNSNIIFGKK